MARLFVYGTLKSGHCRDHMLGGQRFVGTAVTADGYRLYDLGPYPGLVADADAGGVRGELYEVSPGRLALIDVEEGVPEGLYRRGPVRLAGPSAWLAAETYFFLGDIRGFPDAGGVWPPP